jgi:DNA repair protein SbcD/Mre11
MTSFTFLHTADLHLDSPFCGVNIEDESVHSELCVSSRRVLDKIVDIAKERKVDFVVIAGDIFDGSIREVRSGLYFLAKMRALAEARIPAYIISGNHDASSIMTRSLDLPNGIFHFSSQQAETKYVPDLPVAIHGRSYPERHVGQDFFDSYRPGIEGFFNIGILHTSLDGLSRHQEYAPCSVDNLRSKNYHYWALGHVHTGEVVATDPWIVYPGIPQGRSILESGAKSVSLVEVEDRQVRQVTNIATDRVRWFEVPVDLSGLTTLVGALPCLERELRAVQDAREGRIAIVRLIVSGYAQFGIGARDLITKIREWNYQITSQIVFEKIVLTPSPKVRGTEKFHLSGPLRRLQEQREVLLQNNEEDLTELFHELEKLWEKLPAEILRREGAPLQRSSVELRSILLRAVDRAIQEISGISL